MNLDDFMKEKYNIINRYDPYREDTRFSTMTLLEIYKIITAEYKYIKISLSNSSDKPRDEEYVRPPDPVIRERLLDPDEQTDDEDDQFKKACEESLKTFNNIDHVNIDDLIGDSDFCFDGLVSDEGESNEGGSDEKRLELPEGFPEEIITTLISQLEKEQFKEARITIASIQELKHMDWIKALSYEDKKLKDLITAKSPDAIKCLKF